MVSSGTGRTDQNSDEGLPNKNLFMMCRTLNLKALRTLSSEYHVRHCRPEELEIWKAMPFDDTNQAVAYRAFMTEYFRRVYEPEGELFFRKCLFVCDNADNPIGTGFVWKAYGELSTVHWLKVLKSHEGKGIGRALLSTMLSELGGADYPVYLHTQPESYRAIGLYADFGFSLLTDPVVGRRTNDLDECLPSLERSMTDAHFRKLRTARAPESFLKALASEEYSQF